ncbi:hypothetical protein NJB1604_40490 [Mycobacterium marinum]|nr:hypothetical protein NJB1604_40490 [Mycobacterium marinum]
MSEKSYSGTDGTAAGPTEVAQREKKEELRPSACRHGPDRFIPPVLNRQKALTTHQPHLTPEKIRALLHASDQVLEPGCLDCYAGGESNDQNVMDEFLWAGAKVGMCSRG